eukprot:TRINITY_DN4831_c0_g1_i1.p1 TRINITY_DN4831_c0_g1~~TRINITY_DN4831_c0_g1_i1.p1  ORF type:complete len:1093 (-),score=225.69 TRINITY_DN4831_c0_g1_i1:78-3356(-)
MVAVGALLLLLLPSLMSLVNGQGCESGYLNISVIVYSDKWVTETMWAVYDNSFNYLSPYSSVASLTSWSQCLADGQYFVVYFDDTLDPHTKYSTDKYTYNIPGDGFAGSTNGFAVFADGMYVTSDIFGPYDSANNWNGMDKGYVIVNGTAQVWYSDTPMHCLYPPEYAGYADYICYFQTNSFYQDIFYSYYYDYDYIAHYYGHAEFNPAPKATSLAEFKACQKVEITITSTGSNFNWQLIQVDNSTQGVQLGSASGNQNTLTFSDDCYFDSYVHSSHDERIRQAYLYLSSGFSGSVSFKINGSEVTNGPVSSLTGPTYVRVTHTPYSSAIEKEPCWKTVKIDVKPDEYVKEYFGSFGDLNDWENFYYSFTADGFTPVNNDNLSYVVCLSYNSSYSYITDDSYADGITNGAIAIYLDFDLVFSTTNTMYGPELTVSFTVDSSGAVSDVTEVRAVHPCAAGTKLLRLGFSPDMYPYETSFAVQGLGNMSNVSLAFSIYDTFGDQFDYKFKSTDSNFEYPVDFCIEPGQYAVSLIDYDGFCCQYGNGFVNVYYDGVLLDLVQGDFTGTKTLSLTARGDGTADFSANPARTFVVFIHPDYYPGDISWNIQSSDGNVVHSQSYTSMDTSDQTELVSLVSGKYSFVISDYAADGICCSSGMGYFKLGIQQDDGSTFYFYTDDGNYGAGRTVKFQISTSGNASIDDGSCAVGYSKYVMRIWPDSFPQETSWSLVSTSNVLWGSGQLTYTDSPFYQYADCIPNTASYFLTVYDESGDGMCCSYGIGKYSLQVGNGAFAMNLTNPSKGDFGFSETISFKINKTGGVSQTKDVNGISFTVTINPDDYPQEVSWALYSGNSSSGSLQYNTLVVSGTTSLDIAIGLKTNTSYRYQILDSYGDGICCSYGFGNYSINVNDSVLYFSDGQYGEYQIVDFFIAKGNYSVTNVVTAVQCSPTQVRLILNLTYDDYPRETSWYLYDTSGGSLTTIHDSGNGAGQTSDFKSWCLGPGTYVFSLTDSKEDGICCTFGEGSYQLQTNDNTLYSSNGMFDAGENVTLTVTVSGGKKSISAKKVGTGGKKSAQDHSVVSFLTLAMMLVLLMITV